MNNGVTGGVGFKCIHMRGLWRALPLFMAAFSSSASQQAGQRTHQPATYPQTAAPGIPARGNYPAPPFAGPPPIPAGVSVNPQQWQQGFWQFNPAWAAAQQQKPQEPHVPWVPSRHWMPAAHQPPQQQRPAQQQASYNPYKRVPQPPSQEYLAMKLSDNPLGLTNMEPASIEEYYRQGQPEPAVHTPWIWKPSALDPDEDEDTAEHRRAPPQRQESFTAKLDLQPVFSSAIVRTPDHYRDVQRSGPSTRSSQSSFFSLNSRPSLSSGGTSLSSWTSTDSSKPGEVFLTDRSAITEEPASMFDELKPPLHDPGGILSPLVIATPLHRGLANVLGDPRAPSTPSPLRSSGSEGADGAGVIRVRREHPNPVLATWSLDTIPEAPRDDTTSRQVNSSASHKPEAAHDPSDYSVYLDQKPAIFRKDSLDQHDRRTPDRLKERGLGQPKGEQYASYERALPSRQDSFREPLQERDRSERHPNVMRGQDISQNRDRVPREKEPEHGNMPGNRARTMSHSQPASSPAQHYTQPPSREGSISQRAAAGPVTRATLPPDWTNPPNQANSAQPQDPYRPQAHSQKLGSQHTTAVYVEPHVSPQAQAQSQRSPRRTVSVNDVAQIPFAYPYPYTPAGWTEGDKRNAPHQSPQGDARRQQPQRSSSAHLGSSAASAVPIAPMQPYPPVVGPGLHEAHQQREHKAENAVASYDYSHAHSESSTRKLSVPSSGAHAYPSPHATPPGSKEASPSFGGKSPLNAGASAAPPVSVGAASNPSSPPPTGATPTHSRARGHSTDGVAAYYRSRSEHDNARADAHGWGNQSQSQNPLPPPPQPSAYVVPPASAPRLEASTSFSSNGSSGDSAGTVTASGAAAAANHRTPPSVVPPGAGLYAAMISDAARARESSASAAAAAAERARRKTMESSMRPGTQHTHVYGAAAQPPAQSPPQAQKYPSPAKRGSDGTTTNSRSNSISKATAPPAPMVPGVHTAQSPGHGSAVPYVHPPPAHYLFSPPLSPAVAKAQPRRQHRIRRGYWNNRGDHLTPDGYIVYAPEALAYPAELAGYPLVKEGYQDDRGAWCRWVQRPELRESLPREGKPAERPYESFVVYVDQ